MELTPNYLLISPQSSLLAKEDNRLVLFNCITKLDQFTDKSFEELRLEDYAIGKRYPSRIVNDQVVKVVPVAFDEENWGSFPQTFQSTSLNQKERLINITGMKQYSHLSQEELRYYDQHLIQRAREFEPLIESNTPNSTLNSSSLDSSASNTVNQASSTSSKFSPTCPVCLEDVMNLTRRDGYLMSPVCGHIMCKICKESLFKKSLFKKIECPLCRKEWKQSDFHPIYLN